MRLLLDKRGFTLIEMVVVLAVIGILSGMILRIGQGVAERRRIARAKGEMLILAGALEQYRMAYGDYPRIGNEEAEAFGPGLYGSLLGVLGPEGRRVVSGRAVGFIKAGSLTVWNIETKSEVEGWLDGDGLKGSEDGWAQRYWVDPWGNAYVYRYGREAEGWETGEYVLLSLGPSGGEARKRGERENAAIPVDGIITKDYFKGGGTYDNLIAE